jgi:hypothetical protein
LAKPRHFSPSCADYMPDFIHKAYNVEQLLGASGQRIPRARGTLGTILWSLVAFVVIAWVTLGSPKPTKRLQHHTETEDPNVHTAPLRNGPDQVRMEAWRISWTEYGLC